MRSLRKTIDLVKKENDITGLTAVVLKCSIGAFDENDLKQYGCNNFDEAINKLRVMKTKYKIAEAQEKMKHVGKNEYNIYRDKAYLEQILEHAIDLNTCNVLQWVEYQKLAKNIIDERNKQRRPNRVGH